MRSTFRFVDAVVRLPRRGDPSRSGLGSTISPGSAARTLTASPRGTSFPPSSR